MTQISKQSDDYAKTATQISSLRKAGFSSDQINTVIKRGNNPGEALRLSENGLDAASVVKISDQLSPATKELEQSGKLKAGTSLKLEDVDFGFKRDGTVVWMPRTNKWREGAITDPPGWKHITAAHASPDSAGYKLSGGIQPGDLEGSKFPKSVGPQDLRGLAKEFGKHGKQVDANDPQKLLLKDSSVLSTYGIDRPVRLIRNEDTGMIITMYIKDA